MVAQVFHVLKWTPAELERTIAALLEEEAVREVEIGREGLQLVSMHALRRGLQTQRVCAYHCPKSLVSFRFAFYPGHSRLWYN
jgi:hypothetical protein